MNFFEKMAVGLGIAGAASGAMAGQKAEQPKTTEKEKSTHTIQQEQGKSSADALGALMKEKGFKFADKPSVEGGDGDKDGDGESVDEMMKRLMQPEPVETEVIKRANIPDPNEEALLGVEKREERTQERLKKQKDEREKGGTTEVAIDQ